MRKLLIVALSVNAVLLFAIWQQLAVVAEVGGGALTSPCETDQTKYSLDTNDDGGIDLSDFVYGLQWFFQGTEAPRVCLATDDLEARVTAVEMAVNAAQSTADTALADASAAEARVTALEGKTTLSDLSCADGEIAKWDAAGGAWVCAEDLVEPPPEVPGFTFIRTNPTTGLHEYTHDQTGICFVLLEGGTFQMGSPASEPNRSSDEGPVHAVTLDPFLIAKTEVTQAQYEAVLTGHPTIDPTPSSFTGNDLPVERVTWDDLNAAGGFLENTNLRLPTEAQWEYAARGGTSTAYSFGDDCNAFTCDACATADSFMWWCANAPGPEPVAGKQPNPFGLLDMHGNVYEWCRDLSGAYTLPVNPGDGERQNSTSTSRIFRGGSYADPAAGCRSANRNGLIPDFPFDVLGFRVAAPLP